jgi:hypothetical protein
VLALILRPRVGTWSGSLVLELLAVVPFLAAIPALFHELAHSTLLRTHAPGAVDVALGCLRSATDDSNPAVHAIKQRTPMLMYSREW